MLNRTLLALLLTLPAATASARGLLVPEDVKLPPLAMVDHKVTATVDDQVSVTTVEQTFRNHTDRDLEATYLFPVPKGASVNKFTMWVNGTETAGELLDAKKANRVYTDIVRKTQDPGLLEYLGNDLMKLRIYPVPAKKDQKVRISFTAVANKDAGVVEYVFPLRADGPATKTLEAFSVNVTVKSRRPILSVYSPTHAIDVDRRGDHEVAVTFEKDQAVLDKDFQLFYGVGDDEIGLTPLFSREVSAEDGYFQLILTPRVEDMSATRIPRDVVLVLDTSGSMSDVKMSQAKKALKHCLDGLKDGDRFGLIAFATSVKAYRDHLSDATPDQLESARKWISDLRAGGGTAILPALQEATAMVGKTPSRSTSVVFFTDGLPTVDETNPDKIVARMGKDNPANLRVFTFGVGDNVNAAMLDRLAESTRAVSTYVRPAEDITTKVAALTAKISHPVLTDVRLSASNVRLHEIYPPQLPDLFHGNQLVVLGRFGGEGPSVVKLTGRVGDETRELVYEVEFPARTTDEKGFVEDLWARRKVGYLLDQIRVNGESKEVVEEVVSLATRYGIATPYTSHLVVPDAPVAALGGSGGPTGRGGFGAAPPPVLNTPPEPGKPAAAPEPVADFARRLATDAKEDGIASNRADVQDRAVEEALKELASAAPGETKAKAGEKLLELKNQTELFREARRNYRDGNYAQNQTGKLGVDLAESSQQLRYQCQVAATANRVVRGRNCVDIGGVWVDDQFEAKTSTVAVRAQSPAYFKILEQHQEMKDVFSLGNYLVWIAPNGTALVVDANSGKDEMTDAEIGDLFASAK